MNEQMKERLKSRVNDYHRPKLLLLSIEPRRSQSNETESKINRTQANLISRIVVRLVR